MSKCDRAWDEMIRQVESELCERGPEATEERKLLFLVAAYLRDIRNHFVKTPRVVAPAPRSTWDVDPISDDDSGDTRPFAFTEELGVQRKTAPRPSPNQVKAKTSEKEEPDDDR